MTLHKIYESNKNIGLNENVQHNLNQYWKKINSNDLSEITHLNEYHKLPISIFDNYYS